MKNDVFKAIFKYFWRCSAYFRKNIMAAKKKYDDAFKKYDDGF